MKRHGISLILLIILVILLILKLHLSFTRQFDPDEFAYLHWTYLITEGKLPYKDFFFIISPTFLQFLSPLFLISQSPAIALVGRLVIFFLYLTTLAVLYLLTKKFTKHTLSAMLAMIIFITFPMTFDKTIELRPDILMTLLFFLGILILPPPGDTKKQFFRLLASGILWSLSFLVLFKIIFAVPAILFLLLRQKKKIIAWRYLGAASIGACIPLLGLFFYLSFHGLIPEFFTGVTTHAYISTVGSTVFSPIATLSPWPLIYVKTGGISFPWIINTLLWICFLPSLLWFIYRLRHIGLWLLILTAGAGIFIFLFPKPYVQYFIIPTYIASMTLSYGFVTFLTWIQKRTHTIIWSTVMLGLLIGALSYSFFLQIQSRESWQFQNEEQLEVLRDILKITTSHEPVYDMVGSYIYRPDSYYICCIPSYREFVKNVQEPMLPLQESLIQTQTKFLVLDQKGYVFWTPEPADLSFILSHYLPSAYKKIYSLGSTFRCENGSCIQYTLNEKPTSNTTHLIDIVIPETYRITITPPTQTITVENKIYHHNEKILLKKGIYPFITSDNISSFTIHLDR